MKMTPSEAVMWVQTQMKNAGYYKSTIDDKFYDGSQAAFNVMLRDALKGKTVSVPVTRNLTEADIAQAAAANGLKPAHIKAVIAVESNGGWFTDMRADILDADGPGGFIDGDMPKILFEAHWFDKFTDGQFRISHPNLSSKSWNRALYVGGQGEYLRLHRAMLLAEEAALKSASWGMFQIMGFNHEKVGYPNVFEFVTAMKVSELKHIEAFLKFVKASSYKGKNLLTALQQNDFDTFTGGYNGTGQIPVYSAKMKAAFKKFS